jgi:hypothetical protein
LPDDGGRGIDIGCRCYLDTSLALLRRSIERCAGHHRDGAAVAQQVLGDAKIANEDALIRRDERRGRFGGIADHGFVGIGRSPADSLEEDIGRLDVAMNDAGLMDGREAVREGVDQGGEPARIQARRGGSPAEAVRESTAIGKVHYEVGPTVGQTSDVVNRDDVRRFDAAQ